MNTKTKALLKAFLMIDFILIVLGIWVIIAASFSKVSFPMWVEVPSQTVLEPMDYAELECLGVEHSVAADGNSIDVIKIRRTLSKPIQKYSNYWVVYASESNSKWHLTYYTNFAEQMVSVLVQPGEDVLECAVPSNTFSKPGSYKIGFPEVGYCDIQVSEGMGNP